MKKVLPNIKSPTISGGGSTYRRTIRSVVTTLCDFARNFAICISLIYGICILASDQYAQYIHRLFNSYWSLVIKLLKHNTVLQPFYIALSSDLQFHALYDDISVGSGKTIYGAIDSIPNKHLYGISNSPLNWGRLILESTRPLGAT